MKCLSGYDQVREALERLQDSTSSSALIDLDNLRQEEVKIQEQLDDAVEHLRGIVISTRNQIGILSRAYPDMADALVEFRGEAFGLIDDLREGRISVIEYQEALTKIATSTPVEEIAWLSRHMRDQSEDAAQYQDQLNKVRAAMEGVGEAGPGGRQHVGRCQWSRRWRVSDL